jgi:hypothetical protein
MTAAPWVTSWIEPTSSPAETKAAYHASEREADAFARGLTHRGVRTVVVYLGRMGR